jgi:transglutaminase superfamily protein
VGRLAAAFAMVLLAGSAKIGAAEVKAAGASLEEVQYLAVFMEGAKIGHAKHIRKVEGGTVNTSDQMDITISRGPVSINAKTSEMHIETTEGKPLGFGYSENMGFMKKDVIGRIDNDGKMVIATTQLGATTEKTMEYPAGALMSEGLRLLEVKKGLAAGTKYKAKVYSVSIQAGLDAEVSVGQTENVDLLGRFVPLTKVDVMLTNTEWSIFSTSYVNADLIAEKTVAPIMGMKLELIECSKEFAMSENDVVDFLGNMFIESPVELKNLNNVRSIEYHLKPAEGAELSIPQTPSQSVTKNSAGNVVVVVMPKMPKGGVSIPIKSSETEVIESLKANEYIQSNDEKIISLARTAVGNTKDAAIAAKRIETFVNSYISEKDLSVGYASAAEVAVSRQGDCTEHAVLTAAMCQAAGIPARLCFGIVYADVFLDKMNIFGGHAWTQVYIGGEWIDLDATQAPGGFDAGHITLATSDGRPEGFFKMINTMGYFTIEKAIVTR